MAHLNLLVRLQISSPAGRGNLRHHAAGPLLRPVTAEITAAIEAEPLSEPYPV